MLIEFNLTTDEGRQRFYNSHTWRKLSSAIKSKFNYECQSCKEAGKVTTSKQGARLITHHIKELKHRPDLAMDESNLTVLCQACHEAIHSRVKGQPAKRWDDEWY